MIRRTLTRLLVLGAAAGAVYALRGYLRGAAGGVKKGDVQVVLDTGAAVEPDPQEAREFAEIARRVLEIQAQG